MEDLLRQPALQIIAAIKARDADSAIKNGDELGPLHGLPITIKDTVDVKGYKTTCGSYLLKDYHASHNSTCVSRLRAAGAVILGTTNSPELLSAYESDNLIYGASILRLAMSVTLTQQAR